MKSFPVELIFPTDSDITTSIFFGPVFLAETNVGGIWSSEVDWVLIAMISLPPPILSSTQLPVVTPEESSLPV